MGLASDLPIFRDTTDLVSYIVDVVEKFPKKYKFTLGDKLMNTSLALFEYIQLANRAGTNKESRAKYLSGFLIKFELLKVIIRICEEKKIVSLKQAAHLALLTTKISKQATAWKNK